MISLYDKRIVKKRPYLTTKNWFYPEEDVKEAIKELSESLEPLNKWRNVFHASSDKDEMECAIAINEFFEEFKRIFGKELV